MKVNLFFDGACSVNPGGAMGFGAWCEVKKDDDEVLSGKTKALEHGFSLKSGVEPNKNNSNNVAEYRALSMGLQKLIDLDATKSEITIQGDSLMVCNQLTGDMKVSNGRYIGYYEECVEKLRVLKKGNKIFIGWIPREQNVHADLLSKQGMKPFEKTHLKEI